MRTKEYELFIQQTAIEFYENGQYQDLTIFREKPKTNDSLYVKCKLLVDLPEKHISITKSQLSELLLDMANEDIYLHHREQVIEKLFGKDAG